MLRLHPPAHEVPDNVWHTLLILVLGSWFVWQTGQQCTELFRTETPVTAVEQALLQGEGHPIHVWFESISAIGETDIPPLLWNRSFSLIGWLLALMCMVRLITKRAGLVSALPSLLVLVTAPGLTLHMSTGGGGGFAVYFFMKTLWSVTKTDEKGTWIRSGGYAAVAAVLQPVWFLPALGLLAGVFEVYRSRWLRVGAAFLGAGLLGSLLVGLSSGSGFSILFAGPGVVAELPPGWPAVLFQRYFFVLGALLALLAYGFFRRGTGWWCLVMTLPALLLRNSLASELSVLLIPLWVIGAYGLAKLPALLDLRHPRSYQSVLLCQLLLWAPVYLDALL
jgi:hypothetical protein